MLTRQTGPLTEDLTIAGDIVGRLFASTTGRDADRVVRLIDVYPDSVGGSQPRMGDCELMVASEILRGRFHRSSHPEPLVTGRITASEVPLQQQAGTFRAGHRIMVQVQSSWFPPYDLDPETKVYRTPRFASGGGIPVLER